MKLTKEQIKIAKQFCKDNGLDPKQVAKEMGNGFWLEECKGSLEGYLNYLKTNTNDGSRLRQILIDIRRKSPVQKMYREVKATTL